MPKVSPHKFLHSPGCWWAPSGWCGVPCLAGSGKAIFPSQDPLVQPPGLDIYQRTAASALGRFGTWDHGWIKARSHHWLISRRGWGTTNLGQGTLLPRPLQNHHSAGVPHLQAPCPALRSPPEVEDNSGTWASPWLSLSSHHSGWRRQRVGWGRGGLLEWVL